MSKITASKYIAEAFKAYGVTHFFYVPVIIPEACKEMQRLGITPIMTHGEKAAAYMADGYARVSHRVGVCGSQTIGGTNLAAGLRDPFLARIPVLAITGGKLPQSRYRLMYQEIDDMPIYQAVTKFNATVENADRLPDLLNTAFRAATTGMPQPVHLELPGIAGMDLGDIDTELEFEPRYGQFPAIRTLAPAEDVAAALRAIGKAKRPIIVAGGGVSASAAGAEIVKLARILSVPVATALNAKGTILDADPLSIGVVGEYSRSCANLAVNEADLIIYVGSLTGGLVTRGWSVPVKSAKVVHIDINPENLGRNYVHTIGVCGDAKTVLLQMIKAAKPGGKPAPRRKWLDRISALKAEWQKDIQPHETSDAVPMRPERLCRDISDVLPKNAIVVGDTGHAGIWMAQNFYSTSNKQTFIRAHGSLGWGFPAAIGAKCAAPDRPVVCFTGDGGFYYHMAEMETAMRYGINVICVINNNDSLNQEQGVWAGTTEFDKNWRFHSVDFTAVANAMGCLGIKIDRPRDVRPALKEAFKADRPVIIEAKTDWRIAAEPSWGPPGLPGLYPPPPGLKKK
ncbi:MAG: thiamine pyrophosphate-binding protein [Deltaproteobacteria bacterium]|nr:thiamine pyrophosphate-binding protein [Deltaproteobacteria bacterium]